MQQLLSETIATHQLYFVMIISFNLIHSLMLTNTHLKRYIPKNKH